MPILGNEIKGMSMQVHWMNHFIGTNDAHMHRLSMFDQNWLCVRKTLAIDDVVDSKRADEFSVFYISMDCLLSLNASRARIHDKSTIEPPWNLGKIIIVAMIAVCTNILSTDCEIILVCLSWFNWILTNSWHSILSTGDFKSMPVYSCCFREMINERYVHTIASSNANHWPWNGA